MPHRPGHWEDSGEECCSMDRRKYLSTLAAGAAFGAVAVGVAACGGGGSESATTQDTAGTAAADTSKSRLQRFSPGGADTEVQGKNLWGYLRVFPARVTNVAKATEADLVGVETFRIPFFNNTGLDLSAANPIVGFTLLKIGCPAKFAIAINLTREDDPDHHGTPTEIQDQNDVMDGVLTRIGVQKYPWTGMDTEVSCDPPKEEVKK